MLCFTIFERFDRGWFFGQHFVGTLVDRSLASARNGGLVVAGDHAIRTLARRDELPDGTRAQDFVRASIDPVAALARVFDCITDYMVRDGALWIINASTDPRREGLRVALTGDLSRGTDPSTLVETVTGTAGITLRLWRIDSLEADHAFSQSTPLGPDQRAWLDREADTLLAPLEAITSRKVA